MTTIRSDFHTNIATELVDDIYYQRRNLYYFLGKINPWANEEQPDSVSINSVFQDNVIRDNILYVRRITSSDISLITPSYVWEPNVVFDQWDHTLEMKGKKFYCIADNYHVYKCLNNNMGTASTVEPTGTPLFPFTTPDGYMWKYMYSIPKFKQRKFLSRGYLPVQKALTDAFYNKGAIEQVVVNESGTGYTDVQLTNITVTGTTTGAGATAKVTAVDYLGKITEITVLTAGSNYTAGARITVTSDQGINAVLEPVFESGELVSIDITDGGYGYAIDDIVNISVGGAILTPIVSRTNGEIIDIRIDNPGAGYVTAPTLSIIQSPQTGVGKYGNATALAEAVIYNGSIVNVLLIDPGVNYPFDTATSIVVSGDGTDAVFSPVIYNGELVGVVTENSGSGYSYINLDVVGAGSGAKITGVIAVSDFLSTQSIVEQTAVRGAIYNAVVTIPGNNYSAETTISITGDGTGAEGYPVISGGTITKIIMTSYGQDYTYANIVFNDPNRQTPNLFINAEAYAILPPNLGHGVDAPRELYADTISIFSLLKSDTELNILAQDYRQYGLINNPTNVLTNKRVNVVSDIITFKVQLTSIGSLAVDDIVIANKKQYRIVSISNSTVELQQMNAIFTIPSGGLYKLGQPSVVYTIVKVLSVPSLNKYSGDLLYVTNNTPFAPTDEQSIAIRTYIKL